MNGEGVTSPLNEDPGAKGEATGSLYTEDPCLWLDFGRWEAISLDPDKDLSADLSLLETTSL